MVSITCRNPSRDKRKGGELVSSFVGDPFQLLTHRTVLDEYSVLGRSGDTLTVLIARDPNMEDGVGSAN